MSENQQPEQVTSNHSVTDRWRCTAMEKKYGWKLLRIERNQNNPVLKWDCVFNGKTEFPDYLEETEED
ncbi:hypothetical protein [Microcoleus sp. D3_18a_C4]|uniref:hypothetical protein n=1 Tax=Microcoleus sp. D3_18a_C4 TaxID=3055332 RepID=UPI002FD474ED